MIGPKMPRKRGVGREYSVRLCPRPKNDSVPPQPNPQGMFASRPNLPSACPTRRDRPSVLRWPDLEAIQLPPEIRLRPAFLLHVEAIPRRSRHGGGSPQGWLLGELLSKLVRGPDLTWRYMGLHARGKQD